MFAPSLLLLAGLACMASAYPFHYDGEHMLIRERRSPMAARTMILVRGEPTNNGYHYAKPERPFNPRAAMAAYATGGSVAAGSFYAPSQKQQKCGDCHEQPEEPKAVDPPAAPEETPGEVEEEIVPERKPKAPKAPRPTKRPTKPRPDEDDEDDEDDGSVYKNFFPVMFYGGGSRGRLRAADDEGDDSGRGPVTAIANSFSQGRGAVASSSAVAHGRPDPNQQNQSQKSRYRARA